MRMIKATAALLTTLLLASLATGADTKKPPAPTLTWSTTMPAIEISKQPLEKVLNDLKRKLPGFDFSISRENVPHDYPILPAMSVENVTIQQFFDLVQQELPGVTIGYCYLSEQGVTPSAPTSDNQPVPPRWIPSTPYCVINVIPNPNTVASMQPAIVVRVFGLAELIGYRSAVIEGVEKRDEREKQASNDILSMIQAALDVAGEPTVPVMKLHPATRTLIFKGTEGQAQIVESAIKALHTGDATAINLERDRFGDLVAQVQKLTSENQRLQSQVQSLNAAATKPSK